MIRSVSANHVRIALPGAGHRRLAVVPTAGGSSSIDVERRGVEVVGKTLPTRRMPSAYALVAGPGGLRRSRSSASARASMSACSRAVAPAFHRGRLSSRARAPPALLRIHHGVDVRAEDERLAPVRPSRRRDRAWRPREKARPASAWLNAHARVHALVDEQLGPFGRGRAGNTCGPRFWSRGASWPSGPGWSAFGSTSYGFVGAGPRPGSAGAVTMRGMRILGARRACSPSPPTRPRRSGRTYHEAPGHAVLPCA